MTQPRPVSWALVLIGWALPLAAWAGAVTDEQLKAKIYAEYPKLAPMSKSYAELSDWDKVRMLLDYSYRHTRYACATSSDAYRAGAAKANDMRRGKLTLGDAYDFFDGDHGGVICGGAAHMCRHLFELFGYESWYMGHGFYPPTQKGSRFTHAEVMAKIKCDGRWLYTFHDPSTNASYTYPDGKTPIDYFVMLKLLARRQAHKVAAAAGWSDGIDRPRPATIALADDTRGKAQQKFAASWTIDAHAYEWVDLGDGKWKFVSERLPQDFERLGDRWWKKELVNEGWPGETLYLHCFPFAVSGGPNSKGLLAKAKKTLAENTAPARTASECVSVKSVGELRAALDCAVPGDVIEVADGTYTLSSDLTIRRSGTEQAPLRVRAKTLGRAEITGMGEVLFDHVDWVVMEGFKFTHCARYRGWPWGNITMQDCHHVRFTRNHLRLNESRAASPKGVQQWVCITGPTSHHNRIDHNIFERKTLGGDFISVTGDAYGGKCMSQHDLIDHNHFRDFRYGDGANMLETLRAGSNDDYHSEAYLTVADNLFERCNGEGEMMSFKCSRAYVLRNTIIDCNGLICLRSGDDSVVAGNFVIQTDAANPKLRYGGVRFYGKGHKVHNNYFENLNGTGFAAPLNLMPGQPWSKMPRGAPVPPAVDCEVVFNTWVDCHSLRVGYNSSTRPVPPKNCTFANNIICGHRQRHPLLRVFEAEGITFSGNIISPTEGVATGVPDGLGQEQFRIVNPQLVRSRGLWRVSGTSSPAVDAAGGVHSGVTIDMDGQPRDGKPDVGADELSAEPIRSGLLTPKDVGPDAIDPPQARR